MSVAHASKGASLSLTRVRCSSNASSLRPNDSRLAATASRAGYPHRVRIDCLLVGLQGTFCIRELLVAFSQRVVDLFRQVGDRFQSRADLTEPLGRFQPMTFDLLDFRLQQVSVEPRFNLR